MKIIISGVLIYLIWAFIYHKRDKSLTFPVILEYLLIAVLAITLVMAAFLS